MSAGNTYEADANSAKILCFCFLAPLSEARRRYTIRKLLKNNSSDAVVLSLLGATSDESNGAEEHPEKRETRDSRDEREQSQGDCQDDAPAQAQRQFPQFQVEIHVCRRWA